ncbi:hypothetical protein ACFE04_022537 [Oxalis oulophora]
MVNRAPANLFSSADATELARINNVSTSATFPNEKEVIIPVICSCSGQDYYYQANTSYVTAQESYFFVANNTYQGLSTCNILMKENKYDTEELFTGFILEVPLRCACPTKNQTVEGIKFLLTYSVTWGTKLLETSEKFNVSLDSMKNANGFIDDYPPIYPFTTILVPLLNEPSISQNSTQYSTKEPSISQNNTQYSTKVKRTGKYVILIGIGVFLVVLCFALAMFFLYSKRLRSRGCEKKDKEEIECALPENFRADILEVDKQFNFYKYKELVEGSGNFSSENWLGGSVFCGFLRREVLAIKKVSKDVSKEVHILSRINHFNLIHLHGICQHLDKFYLVFDFIENGSLQEWLEKKICPKVRNLSYRIQIAVDISNGLQYLHNFTYPAYVHKDINTSNILLDRNLRAKIANFSLARSAEYEESRILSLTSKGYEAPEYVEYMLVTVETDIYAFGVVLLELITGKQAVFVKDGIDVILSEQVFAIMENKNAEDELIRIIDPNLQVENANHMEIVMRMVKLSLACLAEEPEKRMKIANIVTSLLRIQMDTRRT